MELREDFKESELAVDKFYETYHNHKFYMTGGGLILGYIGIAAIFAYLSINLDPDHGTFKLLNLFAAYLTTIVTGFVAIQYTAVEYPDTGLHELVSSIGSYYTYILIFILGYFVVYIIYQVMKDMVKL